MYWEDFSSKYLKRLRFIRESIHLNLRPIVRSVVEITEGHLGLYTIYFQIKDRLKERSLQIIGF